jgi:hypothetical protein
MPEGPLVSYVIIERRNKFSTKRNIGEPAVLSAVCAWHGAWRASAICMTVVVKQ